MSYRTLSSIHAFLVCPLLLIGSAQASVLSDKADAFDRWINERSGNEKFPHASTIATRFVADFSDYFSAERIKVLGDDELQALFLTTSTAAFYSAEIGIVERMPPLIAELEARKTIQPKHYEYWQEILIGARQFDQARVLQQQHPQIELQPVPEVVDQTRGSGPSVLALSADGRQLIRKSAEIPRSGLIILFSHLCNPCRRALPALQAEAELQPLLQEKTLWLRPADTQLQLESWHDWRTAHPEVPLVMAYANAEWPMIEEVATPIFFVMHEGRVHKRIIGWPREGRMDELKSALRAAGLMGARTPEP